MRAGQKQSKVWIPTKKGGHETVLKCGYPDCFYVSMSKAENDRHVRCHHSYDPIDFDALPDDLLAQDLAKVDFDLGADAVPVVPKRKKPKISGGLAGGDGVEVVGSSEDEVHAAQDVDDAFSGDDELLEGISPVLRAESPVDLGSPVSHVEVLSDGDGLLVGDVVVDEPVPILSSNAEEILAWFYVRRGRNVHACLSAIDDDAPRALPLCNQRKRSGAAEFSEPVPLRVVRDVRESGRKVCPQCWVKISDASKAWLAEELAYSQLP